MLLAQGPPYRLQTSKTTGPMLTVDERKTGWPCLVKTVIVIYTSALCPVLWFKQPSPEQWLSLGLGVFLTTNMMGGMLI